MASVTVDPRAGSEKLIAPLRKLGVHVEVEQMGFGDVAIIGHGPGGGILSIGYEHKRISDVLDCIVSGRFAAHQLPGLRDCYDIVWLIVQDEYRCGADGELQIRSALGRWKAIPWGRRMWMYSALEHWLDTVIHEGGVMYRPTRDYHDSASFIRSQATYWSKPWDDHKALKVVANETLVRSFRQPGITKRMAAAIPGVGYELAGRVSEYFGTPRAMVNAQRAEWEAIPGIGPKIAARTVWLMERGKEGGR